MCEGGGAAGRGRIRHAPPRSGDPVPQNGRAKVGVSSSGTLRALGSAEDVAPAASLPLTVAHGRHHHTTSLSSAAHSATYSPPRARATCSPPCPRARSPAAPAGGAGTEQPSGREANGGRVPGKMKGEWRARQERSSW